MEEVLEQFVGVSCSVVGVNGIESISYSGVCSPSSGKKVTGSTRFLTASISKLFVATAILQLYELKKLDIDVDINEYIDIKVDNPYGGIITARLLMEHRSGLHDTEIGLEKWRYSSFSSISLGEHIKRHIVQGGEYYSSSLWRPSGKYFYSNAGFTLLGYLLEQVSCENFSEYMGKHIMEPLGMTTATWDIPTDDCIAIPCVGQRELGNYCVAEYPACQLRASVEDLSKFLQFFISGEVNRIKILREETVRLMCPLDFYKGLGWWGRDSMYGYHNEDVWIHGGFMDGVRTQINFYPQHKKGFIILTNCHKSYKRLENLLLQQIKQ